MLTIDEMKSAAQAEIDRRGEELVGVAKTILDNPEPGFREQKTSRLVAEKLRQFQVPLRGRHSDHRAQGRPQGRVAGTDGRRDGRA